MEEIWKDVVGYGGAYQVSNYGNVRNAKGNILKPQPRRHGYLSVWLYGGEHLKERNGKAFSIHRIVADAFLPNPDNLLEVNHIDENKQNNRADNLEWCSHKDNSNHGTRGERIGVANKNGARSKAICQYSLDGKFVARFESLHEADRQTGISYKSIWNALNGRDKTSHGYIWKYA